MTPLTLMLAFVLAAEPLPASRLDLYGDPLPDGAIARLGTERYRRVARSAIAILPDGKTYREVHSGAGVTVRDCNLADGRLLRQLVIASESTDVIGLSRDGRVLASKHVPGSLDLWDAATGKRLRSMPLGNQFSAQRFVLSPD